MRGRAQLGATYRNARCEVRPYPLRCGYIPTDVLRGFVELGVSVGSHFCNSPPPAQGKTLSRKSRRERHASTRNPHSREQSAKLKGLFPPLSMAKKMAIRYSGLATCANSGGVADFSAPTCRQDGGEISKLFRGDYNISLVAAVARVRQQRVSAWFPLAEVARTGAGHVWLAA